MIDEKEFAVLNAVYLKKMATVSDIAGLTEFPMDSVEELVAQFSTQEFWFSTPAGMLLMPAGTECVLEFYDRQYERARLNPSLAAWYERFETLNTRFVALVSDWQLSGGDEQIQERMLQVVEKLVVAIGPLLELVPRYDLYRRRLERAMARVDAGEREYVSNPTKDSIHNIWFEFHEDVLAVLGRPRDTT